MALIQNPNYNPNDPNSQRFIFDNLDTVVNQITGQTATQAKTTSQPSYPYGYTNPDTIEKAALAKEPPVISSQRVKKEFIDPIRQAITQPETPKVETPKPTAEDELIRREADAQKTETEKRYESEQAELNAILDPLKARLERQKQDQISNIQGQYTRLRAEQEKANARRVQLQQTIGVRFGGRFVPEQTADLVQEQVNIGLQAVSELNAEESATISKINSAFDEESYSLGLKEYEALKEIRKRRDEKLNEIEKTQLEWIKKIQDATKAMNLDVVINELYDKGVTEAGDVLAELKQKGIVATLSDIEKSLKILNPDDSLAGVNADLKTYKYLQSQKDPSVEGLNYTEWKASVETATAKAKQEAGIGLSDFEAAFQRTYGRLPNVQELRNYTESKSKQSQVLKTSMFVKARPFLEQSVGEDGYVDPRIYLQLRSDYAEIIGDPSGFDNVFSLLLSPQERARLGVGKAVGVKSTDEGEEDIY